MPVDAVPGEGMTVVLVSVLGVLAVAGYLALLVRSRRGMAWGWWRLASLGLGWLLLVAAVWAHPSRFGVHHWVGGMVVGALSTVVSFLFVVADPLALVLHRRPDGLLARVLRLRVLHWLVFPLVAGPLNCALLIVVFTSGWYLRVGTGGWGWLGLVSAVLAGGLATDAGLLAPELLPDVGPGMRMLYSAVDGLLDEIPGIAVMATVDQWTGAAMWCVAQPVVLPMMAVLGVQWVRADREQAREEDARLDEAELAEARR